MICVQESTTSLLITGDPEDVEDLERLAEMFRFRPNGYFYAPSYQRWSISDGAEGWDGFIRPMARRSFDRYSLPRGRKADLLRYLDDLGISADLEGLLKNPLEAIELDDVRPDLIAGKFALDLRQRQCIMEWLRAGVGLVQASVGSGKTEMFGGAAALLRELIPDARFIYITPSERLVKQSSERLRSMLPGWDIGQYGGGKHNKDASDMVVCTVAILNRNFGKLMHEGFFDTFSAVLYDEVHHAASPSSQNVLEAIPAFFRFGASDSAKEKDPSKYYAIRGQFGPRLLRIDSAPLIESGRLAAPRIYIVDIDTWKARFDHVTHKAAVDSKAFVLLDNRWVEGKYKGPVYELNPKNGKIVTRKVKTAELDEFGCFIDEDRPVIAKGLHAVEIDGQNYEVESRWCLLDRLYDRAIIQFKDRNNLVVDWARHFSAKGDPTVVVATRTTHVYILEGMLKRVVDPNLVRILIGYEDSSPQQRDEMFTWFKSTPGAILVTPLVKEGVSINEIRAVVVADHVADAEVARQIIGRALRPKLKDNRAHVVWFWDRQNKTLSRSCRQLFDSLETADGFQFFRPCAGPDSVPGS